ncbi:MAG: hypothetical protein ACPF8V_01205 [Luteibaculum sp.]
MKALQFLFFLMFLGLMACTKKKLTEELLPNEPGAEIENIQEHREALNNPFSITEQLEIETLFFLRNYSEDQREQMLEEVADFAMSSAINGEVISPSNEDLILGRIEIITHNPSVVIPEEYEIKYTARVTKLMDQTTQTPPTPAEAPCPKIYSEKVYDVDDFKDLLEEIYGPDRDVNVEYRSCCLGVGRKVTWQYMDC